MSDGKLVFIRPADGTGRLVFGDSTEVTAPAAQIGIDCGFADDIPASVKLLWDANVSRDEMVFCRTRWQAAEPASARVATRWQDSAGVTSRTGTRWQRADAASGRTATRWQAGEVLTARTATRWQGADALRHVLAVRWQESERLRSITATRWQDADALRHALVTRWQEGLRLRALESTHWQTGQALSVRLAHRSGPALPVQHGVATRWQNAMRVPAGLSQPLPPQPPGPPCYDPATLGTLVFSESWAGDGRLVFVCVRGGGESRVPLVVLPARFYMSVRSLHCYLLPSMEEVPIYDVTMTADRGSFGRTFSASAPLDVEPALQPAATVPPSVRIVLDGIEHDFMLSPPEIDDAFEDRVLRFSGRSLTAAMARPYSRETQRLNTAARNAQQLALEALEFTGVDLDWGLIDWLIPAGAWSHSGTPLQAVQTLVEAAGGYLQSARTGAQLVARHPYPDFNSGAILGLPWNWYQAGVVPDVELAADAVDAVSRVWTVGADIDGVWLSGQAQGISAHYKRTGTAGAKLAQAVTDPLLTHVDALRWRGRSIVAAGGLKQLITLKTPVFSGPSQPGILEVGQLLQVNTSPPWRGRIRSVSVSAEWGGEVTQTVRVERHMEVAP